MNRPIKRIALAVLVMFVILLVDVNYLQAVQAPSLANRPLNNRSEFEQNQVQRGNIVTADGVTLATSKKT
ncbi:MAG: peptidoglycan D,D-transpeptidase FtsI family protein, partial [Trebonia sp.]